MGLLDAVKKALGRAQTTDTEGTTHSAKAATEEEEIVVHEVTSGDLMAELKNGSADKLLLLDVRENYERAQGYIPDSMHIPMNSIPSRLQELDPEQEIIVYCAHGNRSYGVTGWLMQQGYKARSLKGGIVDWQHKHGPVERVPRG
jgi:rhodanese-related sulfurtransferase